MAISLGWPPNPSVNTRSKNGANDREVDDEEISHACWNHSKIKHWPPSWMRELFWLDGVSRQLWELPAWGHSAAVAAAAGSHYPADTPTISLAQPTGSTASAAFARGEEESVYFSLWSLATSDFLPLRITIPAGWWFYPGLTAPALKMPSLFQSHYSVSIEGCSGQCPMQDSSVSCRATLITDNLRWNQPRWTSGVLLLPSSFCLQTYFLHVLV